MLDENRFLDLQGHNIRPKQQNLLQLYTSIVR